MKRLLFVIFTLMVLSAAPAYASINPFWLIAKYESDFGANQHNSTSTSSGLFGFLDSTWQSDLKAMGINGPASAYQADASLQFAVASYEMQQRGLSAWTCAGCDPALVAYLNAHGGVNNLDMSGLNTDPNAWASLNDPGALENYFGQNTAGAGGGPSPQAPPSAAASASALVFEKIYDLIINGIMGQIDSSIQSVEQIASGPATALLALAIAVMGMMTLFGNMDQPVFLAFAIRAAIVMAFVQIGNTFYTQWVENLVLGLPQYFASIFDTGGGTGVSPVQLFDQLLSGWWASAASTWHSAGWTFHAVVVGIVIALMTVIIVLPTLVAMFVVFLISTFLLLVMLSIGPLMILALLFQVTRRFFHSYVNVLVTGTIFVLVVDIVLGIFSSILTQFMSLFSPSGSPNTDITGLLGIAGALMVCAFSMSRLPRLIESIGGAVTVSMDSVGRYMAGGAVTDAGAAAALARRMA
jgi:type IV secretion system protein VirB6